MVVRWDWRYTFLITQGQPGFALRTPCICLHNPKARRTTYKYKIGAAATNACASSQLWMCQPRTAVQFVASAGSLVVQCFVLLEFFSDPSDSYEGLQPMKNCSAWNEDSSIAILQPPLCCWFTVQLANDLNSSNICQGSLLSHDVTKLRSALKWWIYSGIFVTAQKSVLPHYCWRNK